MGLREARRVLRTGGHYLFNVWGALADNPFARIAHETTAALYRGNPLLAEIAARDTVTPDAVVPAIEAALRVEFGAAPARMPLNAIVFDASARAAPSAAAQRLQDDDLIVGSDRLIQAIYPAWTPDNIANMTMTRMAAALWLRSPTWPARQWCLECGRRAERRGGFAYSTIVTTARVRLANSRSWSSSTAG